jgi:hypothetical protein
MESDYFQNRLKRQDRRVSARPLSRGYCRSGQENRVPASVLFVSTPLCAVP